MFTHLNSQVSTVLSAFRTNLRFQEDGGVVKRQWGRWKRGGKYEKDGGKHVLRSNGEYSNQGKATIHL